MAAQSGELGAHSDAALDAHRRENDLPVAHLHAVALGLADGRRDGLGSVNWSLDVTFASMFGFSSSKESFL